MVVGVDRRNRKQVEADEIHICIMTGGEDYRYSLSEMHILSLTSMMFPYGDAS